MKAKLKSLYSSDISQPLNEYKPENKADFSFNLRMMIGPEGEIGEESFDAIVCTPIWLANNHKKGDVINGRHYLILIEYDYERLYSYVKSMVERQEASDWNSLAIKLSRIGYWEFEDYAE